MNITEKTLKTLEFDKIRELLANVCPTDGSAALARALCPDDRGEIVARRQRRTTPVARMPEREKETDDQTRALREAIARLPQRRRTMVVLHYMEGYDVRETARIMGTTKGAVCAGLSRAREALRRELAS